MTVSSAQEASEECISIAAALPTDGVEEATSAVGNGGQNGPATMRIINMLE